MCFSSVSARLWNLQDNCQFYQKCSGHSLIIKLIFIMFFRTYWEIGGQMSWDRCLAESLFRRVLYNTWLFLSFWGRHLFLSYRSVHPLQKLMHNFSNILLRNSLNLCMLTIWRITFHYIILIWLFFKEFLSFYIWNIS